jgi:hypothetical protein
MAINWPSLEVGFVVFWLRENSEMAASASPIAVLAFISTLFGRKLFRRLLSNTQPVNTIRLIMSTQIATMRGKSTGLADGFPFIV